MFDDLSQKDNSANSKPQDEAKPLQGESKDSASAPVSGGQKPPAPAESPKEAKAPLADIFSETEGQAAGEPAKPDVFKLKPASPLASSPPASGELAGQEEAGSGIGNFFKRDSFKKIMILAVGVVALGLLGLVGWKAFNAFFNKDSIQPAEPFISGLTEEAKEDEQMEPAGPGPELTPAETMIDSDQDGLSDEEERRLGMDANSVDSDGDGLFDREEVKVYKTDPLNADTDNDGQSDGDEVKSMRNPLGEGNLFNDSAQGIMPPAEEDLSKIDTDGDGLMDSQERANGTRVDLIDSDEDGLSDYEELMVYNTDPLRPDTDNDGYKDGEEVRNGYNPNGEGKL